MADMLEELEEATRRALNKTITTLFRVIDVLESARAKLFWRSYERDCRRNGVEPWPHDHGMR